MHTQSSKHPTSFSEQTKFNLFFRAKSRNKLLSGKTPIGIITDRLTDRLTERLTGRLTDKLTDKH